MWLVLWPWPGCASADGTRQMRGDEPTHTPQSRTPQTPHPIPSGPGLDAHPLMELALPPAAVGVPRVSAHVQEPAQEPVLWVHSRVHARPLPGATVSARHPSPLRPPPSPLGQSARACLRPQMPGGQPSDGWTSGWLTRWVWGCLPCFPCVFFSWCLKLLMLGIQQPLGVPASLFPVRLLVLVFDDSDIWDLTTSRGPCPAPSEISLPSPSCALRPRHIPTPLAHPHTACTPPRPWHTPTPPAHPHAPGTPPCSSPETPTVIRHCPVPTQSCWRLRHCRQSLMPP